MVLQIEQQVQRGHRDRQRHEEPRQPGPREVRVLLGRDPETLHERAEVERRAVGRIQLRVLEDEHERDDQQEEQDCDQVGARGQTQHHERHQRDPQHDAQCLRQTHPARRDAALFHRDLVRDGGGECRVGGVDGELDEQPQDRQPDDGVHRRQDEQRDHSQKCAAQHPRAPAAEARGRAVGQSPRQRVADHRADDPDTQHNGEGDFLAIGAGDLLGQPGQQVLDRRVERQHDAEVGKGHAREVDPGDADGGFSQRLRGGRGGGLAHGPQGTPMAGVRWQ